MAETNRVSFGLNNVYYAVMTSTTDPITYGTPVRIPGAVNFSMDAEGEQNTFYADDTAYYVTSTNNGYSGDLEAARIPDSFFKDCLGFYEDANGALMEDSSAVPKQFALLFEFKGDVHRTRRVLYNCTATRPSTEHGTQEDSIEPATETLSITAIPMPADALGRTVTQGKFLPEDPRYASFFTAVQMPSADTLTLSASSGSVVKEATETFTISSSYTATTPTYTVSTSDASKATATVSNNTVTVTGVSAGSATIAVTSSMGGTATYAITVTDA